MLWREGRRREKKKRSAVSIKKLYESGGKVWRGRFIYIKSQLLLSRFMLMSDDFHLFIIPLSPLQWRKNTSHETRHGAISSKMSVSWIRCWVKRKRHVRWSLYHINPLEGTSIILFTSFIICDSEATINKSQAEKETREWVSKRMSEERTRKIFQFGPNLYEIMAVKPPLPLKTK